MPIPYKPLNMKRIAQRVKAKGPMSEAEFDEKLRRWQSEHDEEYRKFLGQYDENGRLKPGIFGTREHIRDMSYEFLSMTPEQRAAHIVSEKKRLGVL